MTKSPAIPRLSLRLSCSGGTRRRWGRATSAPPHSQYLDFAQNFTADMSRNWIIVDFATSHARPVYALRARGCFPASRAAQLTLVSCQITLDGGVTLKPLDKKGTGWRHPDKSDEVFVKYTASVAGGGEFAKSNGERSRCLGDPAPAPAARCRHAHHQCYRHSRPWALNPKL